MEDEFDYLKDLYNHNHHARVWIKGENADRLLETISLFPTTSMWHDWLTAHTYELSFSASDRDDLHYVLDQIKAKFKCRIHTCTKRGAPHPTDWQVYHNPY